MPKAIPLTKEYLEKIIREKRPEEIAKEFNCHPAIVRKYLKKFGIYWSRNNVAHDFFDSWSSDMAYILGFITADGNVHKKRAYLYVEVARKDECVLEYILSKIYPDGNIYHYEHDDKRTGKKYYSSKIGIFSKQIKNSLLQYSIFPNKTGKHRIDFDIPEEFVGDYVRGFFDGDGSIYKQDNKNYVSIFSCQSVEFLHNLQSLLSLKGTINYDMKPPRLQFGVNESLSLRDILYKNSGFSLARKKERFFTIKLQYRLWTPEMTNELESFLLQQKSVRDIATHFNLTTQQIRDKKRCL
jgi:hypothetical protein